MSSFAFSPIRGRAKKSDETSEETKEKARLGSPIPTDKQRYKVYAGEPTHPFNLKGDTIKKIINGCDMMNKDEKVKFHNELSDMKANIGLGDNEYDELKKEERNVNEQLKLFDNFLKTQLDLLCEQGETYYNTFYTQLNLLLYGEKFAEAFANISFPKTPKQGGRKTRKKSKRFRNNLRKNKISRKYIMLKQCGGGKAKMGSKSKPYSTKGKAMKSRRRVCYYKKKGRTLKMKKKKKKSRKKSRRRRRR